MLEMASKNWYFEQITILGEADLEPLDVTNIKVDTPERCVEQDTNMDPLFQENSNSSQICQNFDEADLVAPDGQQSTKAKLFCKYLCSQLEDLTTTFDSFTHKVLELVFEAKEQDRVANKIAQNLQS